MSKYNIGDTVWVKEQIEDIDNDGEYFMENENGGWFGENKILGKTDDIKNEYDRGMNEAWEIARRIQYDFKSSELKEIFGTDNEASLMSKAYTPQEAKAKIEAWEKTKEEIKVGDVCESKVGNEVYRAVCLKIENNKGMFLYDDASVSERLESLSDWTKTGRHIDIQSVLEQIGGKE